MGTNFSEILIKIENFSFTEMHLNISSVKWHPFYSRGGGGGGWANWTRIKHAVWPAKCIVNTHVWINLYQFHWNVLWKVTIIHCIKYLNIIDVMVWFSLAAFTWSKGNQFFICCYEATMNSSASAWSVLWNGDKGGGYIGWTCYSS